jgi:hypothetical protein
MATVVNERDVLMQLTIPRFQITSQAKTMLLSADSPVFRVATDGSGLPASVHITADLLNIAGTVNFTVDSGSTISVAGNVATLDFTNMTTPTTTIHASITENGITYLRDYIINKVADGAVAQLLVLDAPTQNFKFNNLGVAAPTGQSISFTALLKNITGSSVFNCTLYDIANTNLGSVTLGGTGNIRTLTAAQFGAAAYATVTATLGSLTDTCTVIRLQDGVSALAGYLTNELQGVPSNADGSGADFTGASGSFKVFLGTTDVTASALFSIVGSPLVTGSINSTTGAYSVTAVGTWGNASKLTSITFRATYAGTTIDKVFSLNKVPAGVQGTNGIRGNVNIAANGYAAWSDAAAVAVISAAGFEVPRTADIVTLYDATHSNTKSYNGSAWIDIAAYINGNLVVNGTIVASKLAVTDLSAISANLGSIRVDTLHIGLNQVSIPVGASNPAEIRLSVLDDIDYTLVTAPSITVTETTNVIIIASSGNCTIKGPNSFNIGVNFRIWRNGSVAGQNVHLNFPTSEAYWGQNIVALFYDTIPAGTHSYTFKANMTNSQPPTEASMKYHTIAVIALKR